MNEPFVPALIANDLAQVETIIQQRIVAQDVVARAAAPHIGAPDVRIRAALTLLAARLGSAVDPRVLHAAAAVELIHVATSVHDKLIDTGAMRRGEVIDHNRWRGDVSLMVGDYMFALAASEMALAPDPRIIEYFSHAVMAISEGELAPVTVWQPLAVAREQYFNNIGSVAATLFASGGKAGMVCGNGTPEQIEALGRFGYQFGLAYQIRADSAAIGDSLRLGRITLPLIYALETSGDPSLAAIVDAPDPSDQAIQQAHHAIVAHGGVARAQDDGLHAIEQAKQELAGFPASDAKHALLAMTAVLVR